MDADCCIVGAGPAGAMLALLLARQGVRVTLLEAHDDFDRDFRGDTLHPSALEILDQIGLAALLLQLPHQKVHRAVFETTNGTLFTADFRKLNTKFPFIALIPQERFLEFITTEASQFECFQLRMGANVRDLVHENDHVTGVVYEDDAGQHTVSAKLVVACDGRFSRIRKESQLPLVATSPPMDVLWFRLPRSPDKQPAQLTARISGGHILVNLPRADHDQLGYVILKGSFQEIREAGLDAFKQALLSVVPALGSRVEALTDWKQVAPLSVESSCLERWHLPGLLLIGDAAHVMSPVAGVGINYAIQDAVAASNLLGPKLRRGSVTQGDLAAVQKRRKFPTKVIQRFQTIVQKRIIRVALDPNKSVRPPWFLRLPIIRSLPPRLIAFGIRQERVAEVQ